MGAFKTDFSVSGRCVDYGRLQRSDAYEAYRSQYSPQLRALDPALLDTRGERLAFWINLYNALTINASIAFDVRTSVTEGRMGLMSFFRRAAYNVGGYRISLEDIEHGILRGNRGHPYMPGPQFGPADPRQEWVLHPLDARVHFALNCASRSCPPIRVYEGTLIDQQFDMAARNFVASEVEVNQTSHEVRLSRIFRWYSGDFGGREGVLDFVIDYLPVEERHWLQCNRSQIKLRYLPYDWSLNMA